jgi:hypothetical protein
MMDDNLFPMNASSSPSSKDEEGISPRSLQGDNEPHIEPNYPEGGLQAWLVVSGSAVTMFCTFGYLTGFGYVDGDCDGRR